jgi:hypothetical protein
MPESMADRLPVDLRATLLAEIDPGETLRWCDQPLPSRMFRRAIGPALLAAGVLAFIATMILIGSLKTLYEGRASPGPEFPEFYPAAPLLGVTLAGAVYLCAAASLTGPWCARAKAARTVYALTNTRVMSFVRSRSGRVNALTIEPGHPLAIGRKEQADGSGDIVLYPGPEARTGKLVLTATPDPRAVERLIRMTFDPPHTGR